MADEIWASVHEELLDDLRTGLADAQGGTDETLREGREGRERLRHLRRLGFHYLPGENDYGSKRIATGACPQGRWESFVGSWSILRKPTEQVLAQVSLAAGAPLPRKSGRRRSGYRDPNADYFSELRSSITPQISPPTSESRLLRCPWPPGDHDLLLLLADPQQEEATRHWLEQFEADLDRVERLRRRRGQLFVTTAPEAALYRAALETYGRNDRSGARLDDAALALCLRLLEPSADSPTFVDESKGGGWSQGERILIRRRAIVGLVGIWSDSGDPPEEPALREAELKRWLEVVTRGCWWASDMLDAVTALLTEVDSGTLTVASQPHEPIEDDTTPNWWDYGLNHSYVPLEVPEASQFYARRSKPPSGGGDPDEDWNIGIIWATHPGKLGFGGPRLPARPNAPPDHGRKVCWIDGTLALTVMGGRQEFRVRVPSVGPKGAAGPKRSAQAWSRARPGVTVDWAPETYTSSLFSRVALPGLRVDGIHNHGTDDDWRFWKEFGRQLITEAGGFGGPELLTSAVEQARARREKRAKKRSR